MTRKKGPEHHAWKGGRRIDRDGYVWVYAPDHPNAHCNSVLEHRLVMEKKLGRHLESTEQVHHQDGNPANNKLSNLVLLTRRAHALEHRLGAAGKGRPKPLAVRAKIAAAHLGKPKASRGRAKVGRNLEASRENIKKANAARLAKRNV